VMLFAGYQLFTRRPTAPPVSTRAEPVEETLPQQSASPSPAPESASIPKQPSASASAEAVSPLPSPAPSVPPHAKRALREPGAVREKVLPPVPQKSRRTIHGRIRVGVAVSVDTSGRVTAATLRSVGPSRYFANLALASSRKWKFSPPKSDGEPVPSQWL
jgi:TonB family protein